MIGVAWLAPVYRLCLGPSGRQETRRAAKTIFPGSHKERSTRVSRDTGLIDIVE